MPSSVIIETLVKLKPYFKEDILIVNLSKGLFVGGVTIVDSIKVLKQGKVRRAKLYYLRSRKGKAAKIKTIEK